MSRYILRYTGQGPAPAADVASVRRVVDVVDATPRMLLVDGPARSVSQVVGSLANWIAVPESIVPNPRIRPDARRGQRRAAGTVG